MSTLSGLATIVSSICKVEQKSLVGTFHVSPHRGPCLKRELCCGCKGNRSNRAHKGSGAHTFTWRPPGQDSKWRNVSFRLFKPLPLEPSPSGNHPAEERNSKAVSPTGWKTSLQHSHSSCKDLTLGSSTDTWQVCRIRRDKSEDSPS